MPTLSKPKRKAYLPEVEHFNSDNYDFHNSKAWRKCSRAYRSKHPLCEVARHRNETRASEQVDHIIPISLGGSKFDSRNHMAVSKYWHERKSQLQSRGLTVETVKNDRGELIPKERNDWLLLIDEHYPREGGC